MIASIHGHHDIVSLLLSKRDLASIPAKTKTNESEQHACGHSLSNETLQEGILALNIDEIRKANPSARSTSLFVLGRQDQSHIGLRLNSTSLGIHGVNATAPTLYSWMTFWQRLYSHLNVTLTETFLMARPTDQTSLQKLPGARLHATFCQPHFEEELAAMLAIAVASHRRLVIDTSREELWDKLEVARLIENRLVALQDPAESSSMVPEMDIHEINELFARNFTLETFAGNSSNVERSLRLGCLSSELVTSIVRENDLAIAFGLHRSPKGASTKIKQGLVWTPSLAAGASACMTTIDAIGLILSVCLP